MKISEAIAELGKIYLAQGDVELYSCFMYRNTEGEAQEVNEIQVWPIDTDRNLYHAVMVIT